MEIIAEIEGVQRNVIMDMGSELNAIARDFVYQNSWKSKVKEHKEEILGINNESITTDGKLILDVSIQGKSVPVEFVILPITNIFAILGVEFMRRHQMKFEFKPMNNQMKWRPNGKGKLRIVPLVINTGAPHFALKRKQENEKYSADQKTQPCPTWRKTEKES
jgi:hypothetical protein